MVRVVEAPPLSESHAADLSLMGLLREQERLQR
jgi:hypothetical protein